jgi:imidazoleglycerol-phosphate dehydratase/histidinol-phosphatase
MNLIATEFDYELIMVSNQDGLGTNKFPQEDFLPIHKHILTSFENEGVHFSAVHIDKTLVSDNQPTRKPGIGMLLDYLDAKTYDIKNSFVIGDRITDVQMAKNLGCRAIWLNNHPGLGGAEVKDSKNDLAEVVALETINWKDIYEFLKLGERVVLHNRTTNETGITIELNLDGTGKANIKTGLHFFDHMLDQIARHGMIDLTIEAKGDLQID